MRWLTEAAPRQFEEGQGPTPEPAVTEMRRGYEDGHKDGGLLAEAAPRQPEEGGGPMHERSTTSLLCGELAKDRDDATHPPTNTPSPRDIGNTSSIVGAEKAMTRKGRRNLNGHAHTPAVSTPLLRGYELAYLSGFVPLEIFVSALHPMLLGPRMPFLPLLCTSVYCAVGVHYAAVLAFALWRQQRALSDLIPGQIGRGKRD